MPMRKSSRLSGAMPSLRSAMPRCTSTAQRTASTTLENSSNRPSPVVLTMRPSCSAILGSISSRRWAFSAASVPLSSTPMRREYPATSSETIAASRRWSRAKRPSPERSPYRDIEHAPIAQCTTGRARECPERDGSAGQRPLSAISRYGCTWPRTACRPTSSIRSIADVRAWDSNYVLRVHSNQQEFSRGSAAFADQFPLVGSG